MSKIPLTLDRKTLARVLSPLIYLRENTILRNLSRREKDYPPYEEIGCVRGKKIYDTQKVIDFYPPGIGAAIQCALVREYDNKTGKISAVNTLPVLRSIAEDLMVVSSAGRES